MLMKRILTALILIPATLAILFFVPVAVFGYITSLVVLLGAWEWTQLMGLEWRSTRWLYVIVMMFFTFNTLFIPVQFILIASFVWWMFALISVLLYPRASAWWSKRKWVLGLMGVFTLIPCWDALVFMRAQPDGAYVILFLFLLIWGADSVAYFAGRLFGKHKLAPSVSPGKSIEGVVAALIYSVAFAYLALWWSQMPSEGWKWAVVLSFVTVVFSIVGDLFESMLKRNADLKDSSQLLPGHGGILDRIDSLTAAAPMFALGALVLGTYLS